MHLIALLIVAVIAYFIVTGGGGSGTKNKDRDTVMADRTAAGFDAEPVPRSSPGQIVVARPHPRPGASAEPGSNLRAPIQRARSVVDQINRSRAEE